MKALVVGILRSGSGLLGICFLISALSASDSYAGRFSEFYGATQRQNRKELLKKAGYLERQEDADFWTVAEIRSHALVIAQLTTHLKELAPRYKNYLSFEVKPVTLKKKARQKKEPDLTFAFEEAIEDDVKPRSFGSNRGSKTPSPVNVLSVDRESSPPLPLDLDSAQLPEQISAPLVELHQRAKRVIKLFSRINALEKTAMQRQAVSDERLSRLIQDLKAADFGIHTIQALWESYLWEVRRGKLAAQFQKMAQERAVKMVQKQAEETGQPEPEEATEQQTQEIAEQVAKEMLGLDRWVEAQERKKGRISTFGEMADELVKVASEFEEVALLPDQGDQDDGMIGALSPPSRSNTPPAIPLPIARKNSSSRLSKSGRTSPAQFLGERMGLKLSLGSQLK